MELYENVDETFGLTQEQIEECNETIRHCLVQIDRLQLVQLAEPKPEPDVPFSPPSEAAVDRWLASGNWQVLPKIAATATIILILLVSLGCSNGQVVSAGPCSWRTSVRVHGPDGHPELTATGVCRGKLWGIAPLGGSMRCTASIDLPGVATGTSTNSN